MAEFVRRDQDKSLDAGIKINGEIRAMRLDSTREFFSMWKLCKVKLSRFLLLLILFIPHAPALVKWQFLYFPIDIMARG